MPVPAQPCPSLRTCWSGLRELAAALLIVVPPVVQALPQFGTDVAAVTNSRYFDFNGSHPWYDFNCEFASLGGKEGWCGPGLRQSDALVTQALGNAALGTIHGEARGAAITNANLRSQGSAFVDASWWDTFTATGGGLPPGTRANVHVTVKLSGTVKPSAEYPSPYTRDQAAITLGGPDGLALTSLKLLADGSGVAEGDWLVDLDSPFVLFGRFYSATQVSSFSNPNDTGLAIGTARYFVDITTPGVRLLTASGTDFSNRPDTPGLPEPGILPLLALGAAGLAVARRRQRPAP